MTMDDIYTLYIPYLEERHVSYTAHHNLTVQFDDTFIRITQQEDHLYIWGYVGNVYGSGAEIQPFIQKLKAAWPDYEFAVYNDQSDTCEEIDAGWKFSYTTLADLHARVVLLSSDIEECVEKARETFGERFSRPEAVTATTQGQDTQN